MKILQVTPFYPPYVGGVERHAYNLARELQLLGNEVNIITSNFPRCYSSERNVTRLPILCKPGLVPICPSIFKSLKEIQTDVVHMHTPPRFFPEATTFFYKFFKRKVPLVITNHSPISEGLISLERAVYIFHNHLIQRWVHKNVQRIIVQGEAAKKELSQMILKDIFQSFSRKIRIIPNGVDCEVFDPRKYRARNARKKFGILEENVIIFIGRLVKYKGVDYLLKALQLIKRDLQDVILVIVGDGAQKRHLEALCQKLDIHPNVRFLGWLPYEDIPLILSLASVLVYPSVNEGVTTVVLEAMSMAKPVVVTNAGCIPDVVQDGQTGFVVKTRNVPQLADAVLSILSDKKLAFLMGRHGRRLIQEKYSWNIIAKQHLKVYEEALLEIGNHDPE